MTASDSPVVVVGAGPVGLTAALAARARGLPVVLLEAEDEDRVRAGSRAIYAHGETLRHWEEMHPGLGHRISRGGLVWHAVRTRWRDREVYTRTYPRPDPERLPPFTSLPQADIERHLLAACREAGVRLRWATPVTAVASEPDGVVLVTGRGTRVRANYVIACDGAHSRVRNSLGIDLLGDRSDNAFVIVDVDEDPTAPLARERVFHYEHPAVGGRNVLHVPFAGGWRIDLQCRPTDDPTEFSGRDGVRRWLPRVLPSRFAERVSWVSTYRFLQVVAASYTDRHARVLLAGEAAHLFAPFGARGMNSGVADAGVAAAAVAEALGTDDAAAARERIRAAATRRRRAGRWNRDAAGVALRHLLAPGPADRLRRRAAVALSPVSRRAGRWLDRAPYGPRGGPPGPEAGRY